MRDDLPVGISEDWPTVQACNEALAPTAEERDVVDDIAGGEHPPQDQYRCELVDGHRGPHHAFAQTAHHRETWLAWDSGGLREFRDHNGCPLKIPLARHGGGKATACMLFDGHVGPHPCGNDLWWWGTHNLAAPAGNACGPGDASSAVLPPGAVEADEWQANSDVRSYRMVMGTNRALTGTSCTLRTTAMQFTDGSVDDGTWIEAPVVHIGVDQCEPFNAEQARQFAALLTECAEELDRMRGADDPPTDRATHISSERRSGGRHDV